MKHDYPELQKFLGQIGVGAFLAGFLDGVVGDASVGLTAMLFIVGAIFIYLSILRK